MLQTYVPLYRKYRPQSFKDLVGQDAVSQTLSNAILNSRVAHAYLFTGPRGTGKTSAARIMAKSLNCETGPTAQPCEKCSSCQDITRGTALDVIEIDAASNRFVEDARDLIDRVQFAPVSGRYKIYIIDEVHMLTPQAFNTLLKTLEEPPPNLVFILATTEAHKVLETIISRCQRFDFRRISQNSIVSRLEYIANIENIKISREALNLIARRSSGGLRDALGLLDQISVLSSDEQEITIKDVLSLIGALPEDMLIKLSEDIAQKDGASVLKTVNELMSMGSEPLQMVKELTIHFRNLLIASTVKENLQDIIDASEEFYDDLKLIAARFKQSEIAQIIDKLAYTERMVRNTSQPVLWLEVGILSICYRHEIYLVEELQKRIEELECMVATGTVSPEITLACERKSAPLPAPKFSATKQVQAPPVAPPSASIEKPTVSKPLPEKKELPEPAESLVKQEEPVTDLKPPAKEQPSEPVESEEPSVQQVEVSESEGTPELTIETPSAVSVDSIEATWKAILNAITSPPTKGILSSQAVPMAITPQEVVIGFTQDCFIEDAENPRRRKPLVDALKQLFGAEPRVTFKLIADKDYKAKKETLNSTKTEEKKIPDEPAVVQSGLETESTYEQTAQDDENMDANQSVVTQEAQITLDLSEQAKHVQDIFQGKILS